jgi:hypothetical protein
MDIKEWVSGTFPIPFFQTWCCTNSSVTGGGCGASHTHTQRSDTTVSTTADMWRSLQGAGLPPKMYECVRDNLVLNNVGVDCIHYLFNDAACREFIAREYPPDVLFAYDRLIPTAFKADLWRYCVLYKYGGVYLDAKLGWLGGGGGGGGDGGVTLRVIIEQWLGGGGAGDDCLLVLERDGIGLWPTGHFGIHNAFIITKPKNSLLLDCIFNIVSYAKVCGLGDAGYGDIGWITRPLFVTGPGLLGNVWRKRFMRTSTSGCGSGDVPDSYATMAPYFRFFFEGDGRIGYFMGDGVYIQLLKVYEDYQEEVRHIMSHNNTECVPHYTVLWSQGLVWRGGSAGGSAPPRRELRGGPSPNDGSDAL